jgi:Glycosyl transferase family 2
MLKLGIIATIADAQDSIDAFIRYHKAIGFEYFYIFLDDNNLETFNYLSKYSDVNVSLKDDDLRSSWKEYFPSVGDEKVQLIDKEVMVRQELNFYVGFHLAKEQGIDWILHIDLDELFYPNGHDVAEYFASLQLNNIRSVTYLNYESLSTSLDSPNIYLSSSYFKINHFKNRYWFYTQAQKEFFLQNDWVKEKYFLYYQNGKSGISTYSNKIEFYDVHSIMGDGHRKMGNHSDPIILHFPCARLSDFIKKYRRLGNFSDNWLGHPRAGEFIDSFHLNARNFFLVNPDSDLKHFYLANCIVKQSQIDSLCQIGLAKSIDFHLKILMKYQ